MLIAYSYTLTNVYLLTTGLGHIYICITVVVSFTTLYLFLSILSFFYIYYYLLFFIAYIYLVYMAGLTIYIYLIAVFIKYDKNKFVTILKTNCNIANVTLKPAYFTNFDYSGENFIGKDH